jgi:hypothetical protein
MLSLMVTSSSNELDDGFGRCSEGYGDGDDAWCDAP